MSQADSILILDDDQSFAQVLCRSFSKRGYDAHFATHPAEALHLVKTVSPKYAVIDLKIGEDNGLEFLRQLKQVSPHTRALLLTGYSSVATAVDAIKLGAVNYLCKPANTDEIIAALDEKTIDAKPASVPEKPHSVDRLEWEHIQRVLNDHDGNISATARALGMHRRTLQRKLQKRPAAD